MLFTSQSLRASWLLVIGIEMIHQLKIWPEHYERVKAGTKTFEIRKNDRFFQKGDQVELARWNPIIESYSNTNEYPELSFLIGDVYPIDGERVVFSLLPKCSTKYGFEFRSPDEMAK